MIFVKKQRNLKASCSFSSPGCSNLLNNSLYTEIKNSGLENLLPLRSILLIVLNFMLVLYAQYVSCSVLFKCSRFRCLSTGPPFLSGHGLLSLPFYKKERRFLMQLRMRNSDVNKRITNQKVQCHALQEERDIGLIM